MRANPLTRYRHMNILCKMMVVSVACCSAVLIPQSLRAGDIPDKVTQSAEKPVPGSSFENPIVLQGVKKLNQLKELQMEYIGKHYKAYHVVGSMFTMNHHRFIQILSLENEAGQSELVYFDMTGAYKKLSKSSDEATRAKIKELEDTHKPKRPPTS